MFQLPYQLYTKEKPMRKLLLAAAAMLTMATSAYAQLGHLSKDLVFTPITPCRIVDTRNAGGVIPGGVTKQFKGWNATNFIAQGGSATTCGMPPVSDIAALAVNLLVIAPIGEGWIAAWPGPIGTTQPLVSNLNYKAGDVLANSAVLKISQTGSADFNLFTTTTTHFVADVTGYYSQPVAAGSLECTVVNNETFSVPANFSSYHYTTSTCSAGYVAMSAYCWNQDSPNLYLTGSGTNGGAWCGWRNVSGAAINAIQGTNCCRIPGR